MMRNGFCSKEEWISLRMFDCRVEIQSESIVLVECKSAILQAFLMHDLCSLMMLLLPSLALNLGFQSAAVEDCKVESKLVIRSQLRHFLLFPEHLSSILLMNDRDLGLEPGTIRKARTVLDAFVKRYEPDSKPFFQFVDWDYQQDAKFNLHNFGDITPHLIQVINRWSDPQVADDIEKDQLVHESLAARAMRFQARR